MTAGIVRAYILLVRLEEAALPWDWWWRSMRACAHRLGVLHHFCLPDGVLQRLVDLRAGTG